LYQHLHPQHSEVRLLVVDDLIDNRHLLRELLQPAGFVVHEAVHGLDALQQLEQHHPHAVLMDMRMPVMDGYEATRRIKTSATGQHTPVVAVTASALTEDRQSVLDCGVDAFLQKPIHPDVLFATLTQLLHLSWEPSSSLPAAPCPEENYKAPSAQPFLPMAICTRLQHALDLGDMTTFETLLVELSVEHQAQAQQLRLLARHFDYDALHLWLQNQILSYRHSSTS
jgi:CheY-like chemotaxis protein